jgi:hypothetical protein
VRRGLRHLSKKIDTHFAYNPLDNFQKEQTKTREYEIYKIIRSYFDSEEGISQDEICTLMGIDKKNLKPYLKNLLDDGIIWKEAGKYGKYHVKGVGYEKGTDAGVVLGELLFRFLDNKMLDEQHFIVPTNGHKDFSKYFKTNFYEESAEAQLFEFSNTIGSIITYILIQAHAENFGINNWIDDKMRQIIPEEGYTSERGLFISEWVERACLTLMRTPSIEFDLPKDINDQKYIGAFKRLYPRIFVELEKIRYELPKEVEKYQNHIEYWKMRNEYLRKHICKHNFNPISGASLKSDRTDKKHCQKCHQNEFYLSRFNTTKNKSESN